MKVNRSGTIFKPGSARLSRMNEEPILVILNDFNIDIKQRYRAKNGREKQRERERWVITAEFKTTETLSEVPEPQETGGFIYGEVYGFKRTRHNDRSSVALSLLRSAGKLKAVGLFTGTNGQNNNTFQPELKCSKTTHGEMCWKSHYFKRK